MYRTSEYHIFNILSRASYLFIGTSIVMGVLYFFGGQATHFKQLALMFLVFSGFAQVQLSIYKTIILEKRMLHLVEPSLQHFKIAKAASALQLAIYFLAFWIALVFVFLIYFSG